MSIARIFKPNKTPTQSGKARTKLWKLEFLPEVSSFIEPVMGWNASGNTLSSQVVMEFETLKEAEDYAKRNNIVYEVEEQRQQTVKIRSYSDNYKYKKIEE
jgi:hypothetical protein